MESPLKVWREFWDWQGRLDAVEYSLTLERERAGQLLVELSQVKADLAALRVASPLCKEHQPDGGARAGCLVCALKVQARALSRIDYLCGPPNEMGLSGYDTHCDEDAVVRNVERLIADARAGVLLMETVNERADQRRGG